jgi:hypothetical protein
MRVLGFVVPGAWMLVCIILASRHMAENHNTCA